MRAEMLDAKEEQRLARAWREERDEEALHRLINAYTRLAVSIASKYRRYGAAMEDLVQEAAVGLMKAAEKFDPDRAVRFSTYANWWIKAQVQEYLMRNWSMVRTGTTTSQKALFFNLRRIQNEIENANSNAGGELNSFDIMERIAGLLGVSLEDVGMMSGRLGGSDFSLNTPQTGDEGREWIDALEDTDPQGAPTAEAHLTERSMKDMVSEALQALTHREALIIRRRKMKDPPDTLEVLGDHFEISKERVRQLEAQALRKMKAHLQCQGIAESAQLCFT